MNLKPTLDLQSHFIVVAIPQLLRLSIFSLVALGLLGGCVTLPADFKEPGVTLRSVTPRLGNGITPEFDIVLQVTNPNRKALDIEGLSYTIHLEGNKVMDGVANDLPKIAPYDKADITIHATADLFGGFGLLMGLLAAPGDPVDFELNAEIDVGTFYPMIKVRKIGTISLQ